MIPLPKFLIYALATALSSVTSPAQATSPIVGYATYNLASGSHFIASPFSEGLPEIASALQSELLDDFWPAGTAFSLWASGAFESYQFDGITWTTIAEEPVDEIMVSPWQGAILNLPIAYEWVTSGRLDYFDVDGGTFEPLTPGAPYSSEIHLLANLDPIDVSTFQEIVGRDPAEGDSVLQLDAAGLEFTSVFESGVWKSGGEVVPKPALAIGDSAFFDLTGDQFATFSLEGSIFQIPEPSAALLLATGLLALSRRRR